MSRTILDVAPLLMLNVILAADISHISRLLWLLLLVDEEVSTKEDMARRLGVSLRHVERALVELQAAKLVQQYARWKVGLPGPGAAWTAVVPGADPVLADPGGDTQPYQPPPRRSDPRQVDIESVIGAATEPSPVEETNEPTAEDRKAWRQHGCGRKGGAR